jgi:hypothetical protein
MTEARSDGLRASSAAVRAAAERVIIAADAAAIDPLDTGIRAIADIYRGAAATVPLIRRRKRP